MASDPEARAQLSRLLGDAGLRAAPTAVLHAAVDARFASLLQGLMEEASASDDVFDRDSALAFLDGRLCWFGDLLGAEQRARLRGALRQRIEAW